MTRSQQNTPLTVALVIGVCALCGFLAALMGSRSGEIAGALGAVVGGTIGALGAALAVYLTLRGQREDEAEKISTAIIVEVAQLAKFPIEQLATCRSIYSGNFSPPREQLLTLMQTPEPTLYQAAAERISRVHRPIPVIAFYMGLAETQATVKVVMARPGENPLLTPIDVEGIGVLLVSQCMLARQILSTGLGTAVLRAGTDASLMMHMLTGIIKMLDEEIEQSRKVFPSTTAYEEKTKIS